MPRRTSEDSLSEWKEKISEQQQSGLSVAAWCRQHDIAVQRFFYWRDKLFPKLPLKKSDFAEVIKEQTARVDSSGVILKYCGYEIHLERNFDGSVLKKCLQMLLELSC